MASLCIGDSTRGLFFLKFDSLFYLCMCWHMWTYLHVRCVPLAVSPGSSHRGESTISVVKFSTLEIEEECRERLLRTEESRNGWLSTHSDTKTRIKKSLQGKFHCAKLTISHIHGFNNRLLWSVLGLQFISCYLVSLPAVTNKGLYNMILISVQ